MYALVLVLLIGLAGCSDDDNGGTAPPTTGRVVIDPQPEGIEAPWSIAGPGGYEHADSGRVELTGRTPGDYTVTWSDVVGRITPSAEMKPLAAGETVTFTGVYESRFVVLALTTDWYSAGSICTIDPAPPWGTQLDLASVHSDAVVRVKEGRIYVVNRLGGDNIQVIDAVTFQTISQFSVGAGTNPQDIAVISPTRAFVSRYETNELLEVNPSTGQTLGTISLAALADADGLCEMHRMHVSGGYLYVQVQRMLRQDWPDPWVPSPPSYLAVVDLATSTLVDVDPGTPGMQGIVLQGTNPIGPMQIEPGTGYLLVPQAGQFGVIDSGGIERVCLSSWQSMGMAITEAALGGDVVDFALWNAERAYAIVTDPSSVTKLVSWNPSTGQVTGTVYNPGGYTLSDLMTHSSGYLFVADRDYFNPGVRIYNAADGSLVTGPIYTGLPPNELVLLPYPISGVRH